MHTLFFNMGNFFLPFIILYFAKLLYKNLLYQAVIVPIPDKIKSTAFAVLSYLLYATWF